MPFETDIKKLQKSFKKPVVPVDRPISEFPELIVNVPDSWSQIQLAPLYDVHIGNPKHDRELFKRHLKWIRETPNVLSFNGGDLIENITPAVAAMGHTEMSPEAQVFASVADVAEIQHKLLFSLPGNHEDRSMKGAGQDVARRIADYLELPFFSDYCFCTIKWRGQKFRLLAHHGAGSAQTAGAQINSARKELAWTTADIIWTGHLHQSKVDVIYRVDYDQKTGSPFERDTLVIISPSYLNYFGSYAAKIRLVPGVRGLSVVTLNPDGRIDVSVHARGKRL